MKIDCTLDALMLAALPTYQNEFGTKKLKGGLLTDECADDAMLPFRKMRPYEVLEDSETTEIQHNAVFAVKTAGVTLTLHDGSADFLGCEARILNVSDGSVTVKGGLSGLDGRTSGITIPAKREMRLIWLSDGWHSSYSDFANITARELADGAVTTSKFAADAEAPLAGKISKSMGSNQAETFLEGAGSTNGFSLKWSTGEGAGDLVLEMTDDANSQFRIRQNGAQVLQAINGKCSINGNAATASAVADGCVSAEKIASGAVTAEKIASGVFSGFVKGSLSDSTLTLTIQ